MSFELCNFMGGKFCGIKVNHENIKIATPRKVTRYMVYLLIMDAPLLYHNTFESQLSNTVSISTSWLVVAIIHL